MLFIQYQPLAGPARATMLRQVCGRMLRRACPFFQGATALRLLCARRAGALIFVSAIALASLRATRKVLTQGSDDSALLDRSRRVE